MNLRMIAIFYRAKEGQVYYSLRDKFTGKIPSEHISVEGVQKTDEQNQSKLQNKKKM